MSRSQFCYCRCFLTKNMFIKEFDLHVTYQDKAQFFRDYSQILLSRGCHDPERLINELESESSRRKQLHDDNWNRRMLIAKEYKPLHPQIFTFQPSFLDPNFREIVEIAQKPQTTGDDIIKHMENHQNRIYSFPVFTAEFCQVFLEELVNFENSSLPKGRPNTMNKYGINLEELGFDDMISSFQSSYLTPLTRLLYPDWGGNSLDSYKAFVVTYKDGEDVDLDYHYDNAEVTINVSLNEDYGEGELYFGPMRNEVSSQRLGYCHKLGRGLLHRGQQLHGALPISEGVRYNLIIWMRSSLIRNELCPMCDEKPELVPVKYGCGDGFTVTTTDLCCTT